MERQYLGSANPYFTTADQLKGYPETRRHLAGYADADLIREYLQTTKDSFNRLCGHSARQFGNLVVDEMKTRGITEIPNLFGPIQVRPFRKGR